MMVDEGKRKVLAKWKPVKNKNNSHLWFNEHEKIPLIEASKTSEWMDLFSLATYMRRTSRNSDSE